MIKQATKNDIPIIEEILGDAVHWLSHNHIQNTWTLTNTKWCCLSAQYTIDQFYIAYNHNVPAACMALTDSDVIYWPEISKGQSLYLHKLAVKRLYAQKGFSTELINFSKQLATNLHIPTIRLDCNAEREKLRALYEKHGFTCTREGIMHDGYSMALYVYYLN